MSHNQLTLSSFILQDYYGTIVEQVAVILARNGSSNVRVIAKKSGLGLREVKEALTVLISQNIGVFEVAEKGGSPVEYTVSVENILKRTRYEKYICCVKRLHGDVAEAVIEELLLHGQATQNRLVDLAVDRLNQNLEDGDQQYAVSKVREMFNSLVQLHFFCRSKLPTAGSSDEASSDKNNAVSVSKRKRLLDDSPDEGPSLKRLRTDDLTVMPNDTSPISWRVDFECIESHLQDHIIAGAVNNRIGKDAADVISTILRLSRPKSPDCSVGGRVSANDILDDLSGGSKIKREHYNQWLKILSSDASSFVGREEGQGGGMYYINFRTGFTTLAMAHIESVVTERFGLKARRIFHLIYLKKHLEQKQIEILSMIRPKDAKELLYRMLEENFVTLTEVPKGSEYVTGKVIYLFSINLPQLARMLVDKCYRSLANLICRRNHHLTENAQLLQQKAMIEAYVARLETQGEEESVIALVKEQITPAEKKQLETLDSTIYRLDQAFIQTDETLFLLQTFLKYAYMKI